MMFLCLLQISSRLTTVPEPYVTGLIFAAGNQWDIQVHVFVCIAMMYRRLARSGRLCRKRCLYHRCSSQSLYLYIPGKGIGLWESHTTVHSPHSETRSRIHIQLLLVYFQNT